MKTLLEYLREINPEFKDIIVQEILEKNSVVGYRACARDNDDTVFSGGTSQDKELSIRITIAEAFERSLVHFLSQDKTTKEIFKLTDYPTTSGFAAGFNNQKTRFRSICEGLERWIWSKWIDDGFKLDEFIPEPPLTPLASFLIKPFDETFWFKKNFTINDYESNSFELSIVVFLGCTEQGIFPGSRVASVHDNLTEHPIIEAHRNFSNYQLYLRSPFTLCDIIQERTIFYGTNKKLALKQIKKASNEDWPKPQIDILKNYSTKHPELFLYRCLFKDFISWHEGDVTRFVY